VAGGQAKLDEALDADEKALAEAERVATERRKAAARSARDLAVLARGNDVVKTVAYYQRATRLDPSDPQTWIDYGEAARDAGHSNDARNAFKEAERQARERADHLLVSKATYRQGDVAMVQGDLNAACAFYEASLAIIQPLGEADPGNAAWQRDLAISHGRVAMILARQEVGSEALAAFVQGRDIIVKLREKSPDNAQLPKDLAWFEGQIAKLKK
jgi:tetratricopeptide (TPR) repeat protein